MAVLTAARAATPKRLLGPVRIRTDGERIAAVEPLPSGVRPEHDLITPGFVDLQVNGVDDVDVATADGGDWERLARLLVPTGVTAWLPTLVSSPLSDYGDSLARISDAMRSTVPEHSVQPRILGAHLEGPFLGGAPGAHDPRWIRRLDPSWLGSLPDDVRLVTLAPESAPTHAALVEAITILRTRRIAVALGHSTASFEEATAVFDLGARLATHLFNGMGPLHHRAPGLAGAALADPRVTVSVIADLVHLHPAVVRTVFAAKGRGRVALVTDAVAWRAGTAGPMRMEFAGGAPRLPDDTLAGSTLSMDLAVRNAVTAGVPLLDAVAAATLAPAAALQRADRGRLVAGARADLVALDQALGVEAVWIGGRAAFHRSG